MHECLPDWSADDGWLMAGECLGIMRHGHVSSEPSYDTGVILCLGISRTMYIPEADADDDDDDDDDDDHSSKSNGTCLNRISCARHSLSVLLLISSLSTRRVERSNERTVPSSSSPCVSYRHTYVRVEYGVHTP